VIRAGKGFVSGSLVSAWKGDGGAGETELGLGGSWARDFATAAGVQLARGSKGHGGP